VDNERLLKVELRRALDDVLPPVPWLEAAVSQDLRKRRTGRSVDRNSGTQQRRGPSSRPAMQLVAGLLVVVVAATAVVTFLASRNHTPQNAPAGRVSIEAYQTMVERGDGEVILARGDTTQLLTALQRWLDALNRSEPPPRFAVIDAQLRLHLATTIFDRNAANAADLAKDQNALDRADNVGVGQQAWLDEVTRSIADSEPGTAATYVASVRAGNQVFGGCAACQSLANQVDCTEMQATSCLYDVGYAVAAIGPFEGALVRVAAPSSLAAQDAQLQKDLAQADTGVLAIEKAQLTGDQAGFNAGRLLLQQVLPAINVDVAGIVGG
jgi:hypothetical protein